MKLPDNIAAENANPPFQGMEAKVFLGSLCAILGNIFGVAIAALLFPDHAKSFEYALAFSMTLEVWSFSSILIKSQHIKLPKFSLWVLLMGLIGGFVVSSVQMLLLPLMHGGH